MSENLTKSDFKKLENKLDSKFKKIDSRFTKERRYTDSKFELLIEAMNFGFEEAKKERRGLKNSITRIENTLDSFVNRLTTLEDEFVLMRIENGEIKKVIKDKLGVEIAILRA